MTSYVKVRWEHEFAEEPVEFFSELDDERYEVRKVEAYRDGRLEWADADRDTAVIVLGEVPFADLEEINSQGEFDAETITAVEFEAVWARARQPR